MPPISKNPRRSKPPLEGDPKWGARTKLQISVRGRDPVPKGSISWFPLYSGEACPRCKRKDMRPILTDSKSAEHKAWASAVDEHTRETMRSRGLGTLVAAWCAVEIHLYLLRPSGHFVERSDSTTKVRRNARHRPSIRPDVDKLARSILDAMTGLVYNDDGQVVDLRVAKHYVYDATMVGAVVDITAGVETMDDADASNALDPVESFHIDTKPRRAPRPATTQGSLL